MVAATAKRILLIQAHPDAGQSHFCDALAEAYREAAESAGHEVRFLTIASLEFPLLRSRLQWEQQKPVPAIVEAQHDIEWAQHLVLVYPLWLGTIPALLKAFLEQVMRPEFAFSRGPANKWKPRLVGKSARVIVTMGMPGFLYKGFFFAHSLKSLERNILKFCGIKPVRHSVIGMVENMDKSHRDKWLEKVAWQGRDAM